MAKKNQKKIKKNDYFLVLYDLREQQTILFIRTPRHRTKMSVKDNTLSLTDHNMVFGINWTKLRLQLSHLLKNCRGVCGLADNRIYSMRYELYKKIKSIGKRYGHYGHPSTIVHYLLPIIAIQGPWGQLQWTGNILNMAILETPSYGQTMATMAASMASRLSANRIYSIWYDFQEKQNRSKTSGTSGTSGTVEYRIHNLLPFVAIQGFYRRLEWIDNIGICPTSTKTSGTKSRTSGTASSLTTE